MCYKSRYRLDNGHLILAIDSLTGQLLEFAYAKTGENILKNHAFTCPQPLALEISGERLAPAPGEVIRAYPELKPEVQIEVLCAKVLYPCLWDGKRVRQVRAEYRVELLENDGAARWNLALSCGPGEKVERVWFPCLRGVYLGDSWSDDVLVYPYFSGIKERGPVDSFAAPPIEVDWRWQEYKYTYGLGSLAQRLPSGAWGLDCAYSGPLSMKWLDYYGEDFGLYFASLDQSFDVCTLCAETFGPQRPGMHFAFSYPVALGPGDHWRAPEAVTALHTGDWRQGAARYQAFHRGFSPADTAEPPWFRESPGLVAHYDFKYQNGGIVHRYRDIPRLYQEARSLGLNHMLLSGWHRDGFDNGYPRYEPDRDLGTPQELRDAVTWVREAGGHVAFYINARIVNLDFPENKAFAQENGVLLSDGGILEEKAGDRAFAVQCIGSAPWREKLKNAVELVSQLGADGVYLDQLAMARPGLCANPAHGHRYGQWNAGYRQLLEEIRQSVPGAFALLHEGCSDAYGSLCAGQLVSTFAYHHRGAFPQMYRYTFPEQTLIDMVYPRRGLAMRPVHVARASREMMDRAFLTGLYFWIYDLVEDNSFDNDPASREYLKGILALRAFWLKRFGPGVYADQDGVAAMPPEVDLGVYQLKNAVLLACANTAGSPAEIAVEGAVWTKARCFLPENLPAGKEVPLQQIQGFTRLELPRQPVSLIYIERK